MSTSPASWERRPLIEKESNRRGAEWGGLTAGISWSEKNLLPILQRHSELEPLLPDLFTADLRREMHSGIADLLAGQTAVKSSVDALIARGTLVDAAEAKLAGRIKAEYEKRFQSAKQRFDAGMVLQARDAFVEILRDLKLDAEIKDPVLLGRAYTNLGTCEWHAGNTDAAAQYFEEAYSYNRDDVRCIANLASAQMLRGEPFAALETVERALALEPENEVAVATKGNILLSAGRYDEAIVFAKEKTKDSLSKYFQAIKFVSEGDREGAIAIFRELVAAEPDNTEHLSSIEILFLFVITKPGYYNH